MPFVVLLFLYIWLLRRIAGPVPEADERHDATTRDGIRLALFRYRPLIEAPTKRDPVLLVHGLGANRLNFDVHHEVSLVRYLANQGFDCWLVDLRGCGESETPPGPWTWTFDDHALFDIPAAIDVIARVTGRSRIHWVGHSMGGMLLYTYLLRGDATRVASGVTLGAPVCFSAPASHLGRLLVFERIVKVLPVLPVAYLLRLTAPLLGYVHLPAVHRQMNVRNVDWKLIRTAVYNAVSHLAPGVVLQFFDWIRSGDFRSADRRYSYRDNLPAIKTPLFVIAGRGDRLVPVCDARAAYDVVSSAKKSYLELGAEQGFQDDYGHIDLIFGKRAHDEVYPHIAAWLATFDQPVTNR